MKNIDQLICRMTVGYRPNFLLRTFLSNSHLNKLFRLILVLPLMLSLQVAFAQDDFRITIKTTTANESFTIPTTGGGYDYDVKWRDDYESGGVTIITTYEEGFTGNATHIYTQPGEYTISIRGDFPRIYFNFSGDRSKIQSIDQWGTIEWTSMEKAFLGCSNVVLNATDTPDLSNVTSMLQMFEQCSNFVDNGESMDDWNVASVTNLGAMFRGALKFNQPIGSWQVSSVTGFSSMFEFAIKFDQDLSNWNVSSGEYFSSMFRQATDFNQDIGNWNVEKAFSLTDMFSGASAFDQNIGNWKFNSLIINQTYSNGILGMLDDCGMSYENYDATLIGWATNDEMSVDIKVGVNGLGYCTGEEARTILTRAPYNWTFKGDGVSSSCKAVVLVKAYLQGAAYSPNTGEENLMRDDLRALDYLPSTSPYADAMMVDNTSVFSTTGSTAVVDWVWVELRDENDSDNIISGQSALLLRNGNILANDGNSTLEFDVFPGNYYVAVKHRNHLGIISQASTALSSTLTQVDLSSDVSAIKGGNNAVVSLDNGNYGMYTGDYDGNGEIQNTDSNSVIQRIGNGGYDAADMDANSQVQNTDVNALINPVIGRGQQLRTNSQSKLLSPNITLTFANAQVTNDGVDDYYEADIFIASTEDFYLNSGQVYLEYSTDAFGEDVSTNGNIAYSQPDGSILGYSFGSFSPAYKDFVQNDNTTSRVSLSFQQNLGLTALETVPEIQVTSTAKLLFHIKIKYANVSEASDICFYNEGVFQDQFFTACGSATTGLADCTNAPGEQIFGDTYDCSASKENTLGITESERLDSAILLFPNPAQDSFYIKGLKTPCEVNIYDVRGKLILKQLDVLDEPIDVSHYESGVYIIKIITTDSVIRHKRLIKKS